MDRPDKKMIISPTWLQVAIITFLIGFTILGYLALRISRDHPPIPTEVRAADGTLLFTGNEIMGGQHLFQKYGLMQYGTIFGHGAYLGPDFTAQYLHYSGEQMMLYYTGLGMPLPVVREQVRQELKANTYDPQSGRVVYPPGQAYAYQQMLGFYQKWFGPGQTQRGLRRPTLLDPTEIRQLTSYFSWASWVTTAQRPEFGYSYTNNWPPDEVAGNKPTAEAMIWSVLSLVALLGGIGIVFFAFGRFDWLGWHRHDGEAEAPRLGFRPPSEVQLTPAQRATAWYFLVAAALFLLQGLLGGVNAHYHVEPAGFYGFPLENLLPYNVSRMWHVQLALFFVASSYLAMGIFLAPMIARQEPKHQDKLALVLFGALVVVVVGSLAGEVASIRGIIKDATASFWIGTQGWEYLDLGRLWQIALTVGMFLWLVILVRGLKDRLQQENPGNMPWLFLYSAISIPLFYAAGMAFGHDSNFAVIDFWRFWVVHLWVEDFLELFTTIMVAYMFVLLGVVRQQVAITVIYLDIILYSIGGVVGTMHHLYFSGAPAIHMALGAFFSAMEVIPLVLLTFEAWRFMRLAAPPGSRSVLDARSPEFPHKWAMMFLVAVGFWNFLGAGIFGFLINLPIVSYYEIGTQWTANHGHAALMGVYGMLAMAFFMFVARYFIPNDRNSDRAMGWAFWSMNIGLAWMVFINLFPVGLLQLSTILTTSYWQGREPGFFEQDLVRIFEWLRLPGDVIFIVGGILPVVYLALRVFANRHRPAAATTVAEEPFTRNR